MHARPHPHRVDADFAEEILAELYAYRRKRPWLAFLLWGTLGLVGGHRFYLERPLTGLLMMFTAGGVFVWWLADAFLILAMVREHNAEQEVRQRAGLPPVEMAFMPPLSRHVLDQPPAWTRRWREAGRAWRMVRFGGDLLVLLIAGVGLGALARAEGVWEGPVAVLVLAAVTSAGGTVGRVGHLPVVHGLLRWSHRVRLFYYYNKPGSPLALLFRPVTGAILAPFRRRDRAEVKLYLRLGALFTLGFLLLDFGGEVLGPILTGGELPAAGALFEFWLKEATITFAVIYAFATPIGAVLTLYLLMRPTHTLPRLLSALVVGAMALGMLAA
ncbi:MAG TPA: TM2 domain-containing protein [Longimicrobiales bacterium]|nr:TM2 domain-containing protein [Longimicrobiales bacterium]